MKRLMFQQDSLHALTAFIQSSELAFVQLHAERFGTAN